MIQDASYTVSNTVSLASKGRVATQERRVRTAVTCDHADCPESFYLDFGPENSIDKVKLLGWQVVGTMFDPGYTYCPTHHLPSQRDLMAPLLPQTSKGRVG